MIDGFTRCLLKSVAKVVGQETQQRTVWCSVNLWQKLLVRRHNNGQFGVLWICGKSCWSGDTTTDSLVFCESVEKVVGQETQQRAVWCSVKSA